MRIKRRGQVKKGDACHQYPSTVKYEGKYQVALHEGSIIKVLSYIKISGILLCEKYTETWNFSMEDHFCTSRL